MKSVHIIPLDSDTACIHQLVIRINFLYGGSGDSSDFHGVDVMVRRGGRLSEATTDCPYVLLSDDDALLHCLNSILSLLAVTLLLFIFTVH